MYYNDPNFGSYADYANYARAKGNTPLSEGTIASYVSAARGMGLTDSLQQVFLGSNPGDWGRFDTAFDELIGTSAPSAPSGALSVTYAAPGGGGLSDAAIAAEGSSLSRMSLTGAVTGGGALIAPGFAVGEPSPSGIARESVIPIPGAGGGVPMWVWLVAIAAIAYYVVYKRS